MSQSSLLDVYNLVNADELRAIIEMQLDAIWADPQRVKTIAPLFVHSSPGIGKSSIIRQICESRKIDLVDVRLAQMEAVDIRGLPVPNREEKSVDWLVNGSWPRDPNGKGIIFLDEMSSCDKSVQVAAYELVLDRRLGKLYSVPPGYLIVAAGNTATDRAVVSTMSSALANRFMHVELKDDLESEHPSLLAKWLPSCNTSSPKTKALAKKLYKDLGMSEKEYRKTRSSLRKKLNVVEVDASANNWPKIDYNHVPSMANLKYKNAFLKHDEERRRKYLADLEKPESGAKINSAASFPCDIVAKYNADGMYGYQSITIDPTLEAMWKALPDYVKGNNDKSTMCVVDTSGSMTTKVGSGHMTALDVALSLGIYFSEHLTGPFKDKFISFSDKPKYIDLSKANSLAAKLDFCYKNSEVANTDIKKTFDLILKTAVANNLKQEDLPSTLLILSDMQFDQGTRVSYGYDADKTSLMSEIADEFAAKGYHLPRLVYWNLVTWGRNITVPMQQNKAGIILLSGFSPALAKMAYSSQIDPYLALVETLNAKRYDPVEQVFQATEV